MQCADVGMIQRCDRARFVFEAPPLLPQEQWAPALKILNQKELYSFRSGEIQVPQGPGPGLDLNEDAIEHYKV